MKLDKCKRICYHLIVKIVLDTSVLFQAVNSSAGASYKILELIRLGKLQLQISIPVFEEYCDVLTRKTSLKMFHKTKTEIQALLDFIALIGRKVDIRFLLRPNLQDENDNLFMELAFASNTRYVITRNVGDFVNNAELYLPEIIICTPAEFIKNHKEKLL